MTTTTLARAAARSHAADRLARRCREVAGIVRAVRLAYRHQRQVSAIERVTGPLTFTDDTPIAAARAAHGPMLAVLADARSTAAPGPAAG